MPRTSTRQKQLKSLENELKIMREAEELRYLMDMECDIEDVLHEEKRMKYAQLRNSRYCFRADYRDQSSIWKEILATSSLLNNIEFLSEFRMSRQMFDVLLVAIKSNDVFKAKANRPMFPPSVHLMVFLNFLGSNGNGNSTIRMGRKFGLAGGTISNMIERTADAILEMKDETIIWPNSNERKNISNYIHQRFGFVNCVGIIDGTLFPLEFKPTQNGEDYYTRKGGYATHGLIACDHLTQIRYIKLGWPGSVHDNRVWTNCSLHTDKIRYFDNRQYLIGDSAFKTSSIMVPSFKKPFNASLNPQQEFFNTKLAKIRIYSEHCIGRLKARFQYLRRSRVILKNRRSLIRLNRYILCACILHNLLISEPCPDEWLDESDTVLDESDELNLPIPQEADSGEQRNQIFAYILERAEND
jgi:hypothetical protein